MTTELYLYSGIYDFVAEELIKAIEANMKNDITLRVNTPGGRVLSTWGLIAKIKEHGNVTIQVDGGAFSAGANMLLFAKDVTALDVSRFMFHRAEGYAETPEEKAFINGMNNDLKAKMMARVDSAKLKAMKGVTVEELYNPEQRIEIFLNATEMKELGLVSKIKTLEPSELTAFNERFFKMAAEHNPSPETKITMNTLAELKEKFPSIYAQAIEEGRKAGHEAGIAAERDRVGAALVFAKLDLEGVQAIIASGKPMTATQQAEFALKSLNPEALKAIKEGNTKPIKTEKVNEGQTKPEVDAFEKQVRADFGLDKKVVEEVKGQVSLFREKVVA